MTYYTCLCRLTEHVVRLTTGLSSLAHGTMKRVDPQQELTRQSSERRLQAASGTTFNMSQKTLVFDNGAGGLKAGFAGQLRPLHTIPNCTAKIKNQTQVLHAVQRL